MKENPEKTCDTPTARDAGGSEPRLARSVLFEVVFLVSALLLWAVVGESFGHAVLGAVACLLVAMAAWAACREVRCRLRGSSRLRNNDESTDR